MRARVCALCALCTFAAIHRGLVERGDRSRTWCPGMDVVAGRFCPRLYVAIGDEAVVCVCVLFLFIFFVCVLFLTRAALATSGTMKARG